MVSGNKTGINISNRCINLHQELRRAHIAFDEKK